MLQTNPDSQSASCPPPFHPPPHPGPTGGNKKISRRLKVCFWNSGNKHVNTLWWHKQIASLCAFRPPPYFSRFIEFNSDHFPFLRSLAAMSRSWDDLLPVYFRMRLARWRSISALAYCFWLLKESKVTGLNVQLALQWILEYHPWVKFYLRNWILLTNWF